jgi:hypothetical protein
MEVGHCHKRGREGGRERRKEGEIGEREGQVGEG